MSLEELQKFRALSGPGFEFTLATLLYNCAAQYAIGSCEHVTLPPHLAYSNSEFCLLAFTYYLAAGRF